jgi:uncharacterized membrane protein (UPF0127 family)
VRTDTALRRAGAPLALRICTGPLERARGLLGLPEPSPGTALWIVPCRAVHTVGMRYPIDVAFVDARGLVVHVTLGLAPFRMARHGDAASVLELRAGECERLRLRVGERLVLPPPAARQVTAVREAGARPALVITLALVLAMAWMLGGCASNPPVPPAAGDAAATSDARGAGDAAVAHGSTVPRVPAPLPDDELALAAGLEYDSRAWAAAEAGYSELVRRQPTTGEHWYRLGIVYLLTARPDAAALALERAALLGARPGRVHEALASARLAQAAQQLRAARARAGAATSAPGSPATTGAVSLDATIAAIERLLPEPLVVSLPPGAAR